ncbi:MAG: hypothetical protein NT065_05415 [Chlamydiae bacterium]|nr:hypothetical protein [Chlamydiota bacterium]
MLPTNPNFSLTTNVDAVGPSAETRTTSAAFGSSIRAAFTGIGTSFASMVSFGRNSSRPESSDGDELRCPNAITQEDLISFLRELKEQQSAEVIQEVKELRSDVSSLPFHEISAATTIQAGFRSRQAKQTVNGLKEEKRQAEIINSLISRCVALESQGQSQDSRLGAIDMRLAKQAEKNNCTVNRLREPQEAPLMLTNFAYNEQPVTKNSQPRSLVQKLGAALMLSSAVAAATYIKNPEAAQLVLRQAGVALTRAIPVIGAAWHSLAQGARGRWAHLAPQFRPLIGAAWQSGQAGLRNTAFPLFQSISGPLGRAWIQSPSSARQIAPVVAEQLASASKAIQK